MEIRYDIDMTVLMVSYVNRSFVKDVTVRYQVMYEESIFWQHSTSLDLPFGRGLFKGLKCDSAWGKLIPFDVSQARLSLGPWLVLQCEWPSAGANGNSKPRWIWVWRIRLIQRFSGVDSADLELVRLSRVVWGVELVMTSHLRRPLACRAGIGLLFWCLF